MNIERISEESAAHHKATGTYRRTARINTRDWHDAVVALKPKIEAQPHAEPDLVEEFFTAHIPGVAVKVVSDPNVPANEIRWETL